MRPLDGRVADRIGGIRSLSLMYLGAAGLILLVFAARARFALVLDLGEIPLAYRARPV